MAIFNKKEWKKWKKLWNNRQKRFRFYQALSSFQKRNNLNFLLKISEKKQRAYRHRMNKMYKKKISSLLLKLATLKKKVSILKKETIKFQLKFGIYDE
jgi:hypothetical protein